MSAPRCKKPAAHSSGYVGVVELQKVLLDISLIGGMVSSVPDRNSPNATLHDSIQLKL